MNTLIISNSCLGSRIHARFVAIENLVFDVPERINVPREVSFEVGPTDLDLIQPQDNMSTLDEAVGK